MDVRPLGNTGMDVSSIGFGAFKIGRNTGTKYSACYALPSEDEVQSLVNGVLDLGINLFDTAPAYGTSEERLGRALATVPRDSYVISTKVGESFESGVSTYDYSQSAVELSIERSLHRLRTDVLDIVLIHSDGRDVETLENTDIVETLITWRDRGAVRAIGMSGKTPAGAMHALQWADVLMVQYNAQETSHAEIIETAHANGVGVLVKKGLGSGRLDAEQAVTFVLGNPGVDSLIVGGLNLDHMRANVAAAAEVRGGKHQR